MNKQEFLNELQSRIRILEEAEQQDILAEYAQHIDLRTAGGLSEEEAIRDFGDIRQLTEENICAIARGMLDKTAGRMAQQGITLEADDDAVAALAKDGFDPQYGARPLRRAIQNRVEDSVAEQMLEGKLVSGDTALVTLTDGKVTIVKKSEAAADEQ